jgi:CheY-like chemotaxis protein
MRALAPQLSEKLSYRMFSSSQKALAYLHNKRCELGLVRQHCLNEYKEARLCPLSHQTINIDLAAIHAEIYNPNRFSEISVVVVDYVMPGMDGLEFCRRIENSNIKKILLASSDDEKIVIDAFNEGLIDRYVMKTDANAVALIKNNIVELQQQYFQTMSDMVVRLLSLTTPACLHDRKFADFFRQIREQNRIVEYYLVEHSGSFFMLDGDGRVSFLIVKNQTDLALYCEEAAVHRVTEKALDELRVGKKIPGVGQGKTPEPGWKDWSTCIVPAKQIVAETLYYYAYLKGRVLYDVHHKKILSYHRYLEALDAEVLSI